MPLIKFDIIEGRTEEEIKLLTDTVHNAMVESFQVPDSDRYQIVSQHKPYEMNIQDTGLGFNRTDEVVVISVTSKARSLEMKETFYQLTARNIQEKCNISGENIVINITENNDPDWSFGNGEAQFINGRL